MTLQDIFMQFVVVGGLIIGVTVFLLFRTFRVKQTKRPTPAEESAKGREVETCVDLARYEMDKAAWEKTDAAKFKRAELAMGILREGLKEARSKERVFEEIKKVELYQQKLLARLSQAQLDAEPEPEPFRRKVPKPEDLNLLASVQVGRVRETYRQRESRREGGRTPVLLAEPDDEAADAIARSLHNVRTYSVTAVPTLEGARERLGEADYPVLIVSQRLLGEDDEAVVAFLAEVRPLRPRTRVILICNRDPGYKERRAFEKMGVFECVARPVENYGLSSIVDRAAASFAEETEAGPAAEPATPDPAKT